MLLTTHNVVCTDPLMRKYMPTRVKMLQHGALLAFQQTYWRDEVEYEGLIDFFHSSDEAVELFEKYKRLASEEGGLQSLADERWEAYKKRYDALKRFRMAGLVTD